MRPDSSLIRPSNRVAFPAIASEIGLRGCVTTYLVAFSPQCRADALDGEYRHRKRAKTTQTTSEARR